MSVDKVIAVVIDGLRYDAACQYMAFAEHLVEQRQAARFKVRSELPSLSRPLYEVLLTGTPPVISGISANHIVRASREKSLFHLAREHGLITAAAAYYWVSELYNRAPFQWPEDREQIHPQRPIQYGSFYFEDVYPDSHLLADAERLRTAYSPHFLYIHTMGVDDAGHRYGGRSREYVQAVLRIDALLSQLVPVWLAEGYGIVITSDHGMTEEGIHGGTSDDERLVPLYAIHSIIEPGQYADEVPQLAVAPLICQLLGIPPSPRMSRFQWPGMKPGVAR